MTNLEKLKLSVKRRMEFIEFCLNWTGKIGRRQIQEQFVISKQQATKDLTLYADSFPNNILYDPRLRSYVPSQTFKPQLISGDASEYFVQLQMLELGLSKEEIWLRSLPEFDIVSTSPRKILPATAKQIITAIELKRCITANYLSMSSKNDSLRTLLPTAVASDGHRWHVRAYHLEKRRYSDFVLSRLYNLRKCDKQCEALPDDEAWNTQVTMTLKPDDEDLDVDQCAQLSHEYGMENDRLNLKVRKAMLYYILRHYGFNPNVHNSQTMLNKSSFSLKIENFMEIEKWLERRI